MILPSKKLKNGFSIPELGIGTFGIGGGMSPDNSHDKKDIEALKEAITLGITHIDTAEIYAAGHSEEIIGKAIKNHDRKKLFIVSKVFKNHLTFDAVLNSCRESLKRLGVSYLDVYLIHAPNPDIPIQETLKALDKLKKEGYIKEIGVSNFTVAQLKEAQARTESKIVTNQIHYSLAYQDWQEVVEYCQQNDILITAYRPVERGILTGKGVSVLDTMCQKYEKTPAQIAINWLIAQKNVVTIVKASSVSHLKENLGSVGWYMEKEDGEKLKNEFPDLGVT